MTHTPSDIRELLDRHGLAARRSFGQNFVVDPNTVRRIARLAGAGPDVPVVEIGPGLGSLTLALVEEGAEVTAVEMDQDLVPILREIVAGLPVTVVEGDARAVDWDEVLARHDEWRLVANLPYNIATQLMIDLLAQVPRISSMLVMVQREVAERMAAQPGDSAVGIPSLLVGYYATARIVGHVPPTVFHPKPRVESSLIRFDRHPPPVDQPLAALEPLIRAGFGQRRKMIRRSLSALVSAEGIEQAGVDPQARPEVLTLHDWARLAQVAGTG